MKHRISAAAAIAAVALGLAACGGGGGGSSSSSGGTHGAQGSELALTITDRDKSTTIIGPRTARGGLVTVRLSNQTHAPAGAQLVLVQGGHSAAEALRVIAGQQNTTPPWLHAEGGVSTTAPNEVGTATVNLPAGKYVVVPVSAGPTGGGSAHTSLTITPGRSGPLPATTGRVVAAHVGRDRYVWRISGLHAGANRITFVSQGPEALHFVGAVRITGNPSLADLRKAFKSQGPPKFADVSTLAATAILDGGRSEVATLTLAKPGQYVLFCPLTDRDGGMPHVLMGMLAKVTVS